ncbi:TonB-dependent receptor [Pseudokordiimonas caeni]|uniref:TonB-dependent receptor n=1 Tax=Pseudokordiimonas caeni TaxID=2997908 RepID=UPI002810D29A|nr:TonB-dependent receptor [Pseudokordiimonas caeni]
MTKSKALKLALMASAPMLTVGHSASAADDSGVLEEIVVTATKRTASMQDVAVAVQAMSGTAIKQQNIGNFDDYIRFLPNVSSGGRGPGQSTVFIRGMAVQPITVMLSGAQGTTPNVAMYLDEQPVTAPGRNLDVYAADMERIEVLAGPQGTLFGASSQAGTIRLITKKPVLNEFQAGFNGSASFTRHGEMSEGLEGYINVPVVDDKLAMRAVVYSINKGGYIDNVPGTFTLDPAVNPDSAVAGLPADTTYEAASNVDLAEEDFNDSYYRGVRIGAKLQINEDWSLLAQHTQQDLGADGVFDYDPEVGDLQVERYFPDELEDSFGLTTWTLEGRLAMLDVVYTGGYLDRDVTQSIDYTGYNNTGAFIAYYTCSYDAVRACLDPTKGFKGRQYHKRFTQELRFATPEENRIRAVGGVFYDDVEIKSLDDFVYEATQYLGFAPNAPIPTANNIDPSTRPAGVAFFNDITRSEEQIAFFGEVAFDIVPDRLTLTGGARYYDISEDFTGSSNFAAGPFAGSVDNDAGRDYDTSGGHTDEPLKADDVIFKLNLSYTPTQDLLFYATWSQGYRPGGFNRGGGIPSANPDFPTVGVTYGTDNVENYELGWKTTLFDGRVRFNGNAYYIDWTDMQISRFDPQNVSILTFIENSADARIKGIEGDISWLATDNLTVFGAFSYNHTELKAAKAEAIELAPVGSSLPLTPKFQANLRARYEWIVNSDYDAYVQGSLQLATHSYSSLIAADRERQGGYATSDWAIGVKKDRWGAELFIQNIWDERPELYINQQDDILRVTTARPRTIGLKVTYDY